MQTVRCNYDLAHFTPSHLLDRMHRASDSPTGSFPTWHLQGTLGDVGKLGASPMLAASRRVLGQRSQGPESAQVLGSLNLSSPELHSM